MQKVSKFSEKEVKTELPFQKKENESEEAWYGCLQYVLMGKGRTLIDAYRIYSGKGDVKNVAGSFRSWAKRFDWDDRARRYDVFQEREAKATISKAIARVRKGCEYDYGEIFTELKHLVIEDLSVDAALQATLNGEIDRLTLSGEEINTSRLRDLVLIRKELLAGRKMAIEQASAIYGFGIMSGVETIAVEADPATDS